MNINQLKVPDPEAKTPFSESDTAGLPKCPDSPFDLD